MLKGVVANDESYVGGKPRKIAGWGAPGVSGTTDKAPIHTLVERNGNKVTRVVASVTAANLRENINAVVDKSGTLMTDEANHYRAIGPEFSGGHQSVNHSVYEYARKDGTHINTAESSHALITRGVYGSFHHVSKKHLQRYLDEFDFRWNNRTATDTERRDTAVKGAEGKRLSYKSPIRRPKC